MVRMDPQIFRDPFVFHEETKKKKGKGERKIDSLAESLSYRRLSGRGKRRSAATFLTERKKSSSRREPAKNSNARIFPGNKFPSFPAAENSRANTSCQAYPARAAPTTKFGALSVNKRKRLLRHSQERMEAVTLRARDVHLLVFAIGNECVSLCCGKVNQGSAFYGRVT